MQPPPNIDELLTGLLDGNLSEMELREVEAAIALDSTLERQLETLRKMRSELLRHRPKGRLGADFAKRVTILAEERARSNASPTPLPTVALVPASSFRVAPWVYSVTAAAAVVAFILAMMPSDGKVQPLVANVEMPAEIQKEPGEDLPLGDALQAEMKVVEPLLAEGSVRKPNSPVVIKELQQADSLAGVVPPSQNEDGQKKDDTQKKEMADSPSAAANSETTSTVVKSKANPTDEQSRNEDRAKINNSKLAENFYTMVVDVSVTKDAIENRVLESILSRHDIASTEEQILTAEELLELEKTGLAVKTSGQSAGEVGLVFVRAPGTNLDKAIREINEDQVSFPGFSMGMQMDESLKSFVKELSEIRVAAEYKGEARPLRSTASDTLMSFSAGSVQIPRVKRRAEKSTKSAVPKAESRAMANALLIIRPAK